MLNVIALMGRLVADPELRHTPNGLATCTFRIAVDRNFVRAGEERKADFIDIVAWRQSAEFVCKYFHKGNMIAVNGSLQTRNYEDKNGNKRTAYEVVADNVFFAESKNASGTSGGSHFDSQIPSFNETPPVFSTAGSGDFEEIVGDDMLPF